MWEEGVVRSNTTEARLIDRTFHRGLMSKKSPDRGGHPIMQELEPNTAIDEFFQPEPVSRRLGAALAQADNSDKRHRPSKK
jgi:hypothetical protein